MCGRFTNTADKEQIETEFKVSIPPDMLFKPRYNIAPTQVVPVVLESAGERIIEQLRWGLIPSWSKDDSFASKLINARAETLAEKASFRDAFKKRRCIIPASGFYEWQKIDRSRKQPFYFYLKNKEVFGLAGLYEEWLERESGELIETFTIITTEANKVLEPVHDRMPVILESENYEQWLDEKEKVTEKLQKLLVPFPAGKMDSYAVSTSVNTPANDSPELVEKID